MAAENVSLSFPVQIKCRKTTPPQGPCHCSDALSTAKFRGTNQSQLLQNKMEHTLVQVLTLQDIT